LPDKEKINIKLFAAILIALMSAYSTYMSTHVGDKISFSDNEGNHSIVKKHGVD